MPRLCLGCSRLHLHPTRPRLSRQAMRGVRRRRPRTCQGAAGCMPRRRARSPARPPPPLLLAACRRRPRSSSSTAAPPFLSASGTLHELAGQIPQQGSCGGCSGAEPPPRGLRHPLLPRRHTAVHGRRRSSCGGSGAPHVRAAALPARQLRSSVGGLQPASPPRLRQPPHANRATSTRSSPAGVT
ncbi:hypothetical protein PVAP13_2NG530309 [Panicum virgatum]|uniref:Uncharacterized protein n=1 Tax=Panicum virgatum TaxID=38727 RepID=A0A8T0VVF3_PANVG|nr:hypothetical protein PVAP13_2NG530309 [Panicum virgatum]